MGPEHRLTLLSPIGPFCRVRMQTRRRNEISPDASAGTWLPHVCAAPQGGRKRGKRVRSTSRHQSSGEMGSKERRAPRRDIETNNLRCDGKCNDQSLKTGSEIPNNLPRARPTKNTRPLNPPASETAPVPLAPRRASAGAPRRAVAERKPSPLPTAPPFAPRPASERGRDAPALPRLREPAKRRAPPPPPSLPSSAAGTGGTLSGPAGPRPGIRASQTRVMPPAARIPK